MDEMSKTITRTLTIEDEGLLKGALAVLEEYGDKPKSWMRWEEFEAELDRAEAAGELPR